MANTSIVKAAETVIPLDIQWKRIRKGIRSQRTLIKLDSRQQSYATNSNYIIEFVLPNLNFIDLRRGTLDINLSISTGPGGTYKRLSQGVECIINRMNIKTSNIVEEIREYNLNAAIFQEAEVEPNINDIIMHSLCGYGSQAERNAWGASEKQYQMPIKSSYFQSGIIPVEAIKEVITVQFFLETPENCIETDAPGPYVISIRDAELHYDELSLDQEAKRRILTAIAANGLEVAGKAVQHYSNTAMSQREQFQINHRTDAVDKIINIMRPDADLTTPAINDRFITWRPYNITQFSLKIDGKIYPNEPILVFSGGADGTEAYKEYLKSYGKWFVGGTTDTPARLDITSFTTERFLAILDLSAHPTDTDLISTFSSRNMHANLIYDVQFNAVPPETIRLDTFVNYQIVYTITKQGLLRSTYGA